MSHDSKLNFEQIFDFRILKVFNFEPPMYSVAGNIDKISDIKEILVPLFKSLDEMMNRKFPDPTERSQKYKLLWYQQGLKIHLKTPLAKFHLRW